MKINNYLQIFSFVLLAEFSASLYNGGLYESRTYFYAGGQYQNVTLPLTGPGTRFTGQIYVEKLEPQSPTQKYPIVFIPGGGQTSTNFLNTPDGRPGWASYFLSKGYTVYLTDPPQRGRSPWIPVGEGQTETVPAEFMQKYFTATNKLGPSEWSQASLLTQWPGSGLIGDATFDAFYASQVQLNVDIKLTDTFVKSAYNALLDKIGAAVILTHSQAGPHGWTLADSRPNLVKGIIAVEPEGPPFVNEAGPFGPPRIWGITRLPIAYNPPVTDPKTDLPTVRVPPPSGSRGKNRTACTLQKSPARAATNLVNVPVVLVTGEASFHAPYDYCMVAFLKQSGVKRVEWIDLAEKGLRGNGHFLFLEKNSESIAMLIGKWLDQNVAPVEK